MREGLVFRSQDGVQSFKAVSNEVPFLMNGTSKKGVNIMGFLYLITALFRFSGLSSLLCAGFIRYNRF